MISQRRPPEPHWPWPGENVAVPSRLNGHRVLCAIKLVPTPNTSLHRWIVIVELSGGLLGVGEVAYRGGRFIGQDQVCSSYPEALRRMIAQAERMGTRVGTLEPEDAA